MVELIDGEKPPEPTKEAMIANFNDSYRAAANEYLSCSSGARSSLHRKAAGALDLADRLSGAL